MEKKIMMAEIFAARQEMGLGDLKDLGRRSTERLEKLHTKTMAEFEEFTKQREREEMAKKEAKKEEKKTKRTGPVEKPAKAQKPARMDDRMAFEAMAVLLWKEEDRPDVAGMSDDQVREELRESVSLLAPEDEAQLATGVSASGDPIPHSDRAPEVWAFFCGLRKEDLAAKEVKPKKGKAEKIKEPKPKKEKVVKPPKEPKGPSPVSMVTEIICKNPDATIKDIRTLCSGIEVKDSTIQAEFGNVHRTLKALKALGTI